MGRFQRLTLAFQPSVKAEMKVLSNSEDRTSSRPTSISTRTRRSQKESTSSSGLKSSISSTGQTLRTWTSISRMGTSAPRQHLTSRGSGNWEARFRSDRTVGDHRAGLLIQSSRLFLSLGRRQDLLDVAEALVLDV